MAAEVARQGFNGQRRRAGGTPLSRLRSNRGAMAGGLFLLLMVLLAVAAPKVAPYDPTQTNVLEALQPPDLRHWLGTDVLGRDLLSRIIFGARYSLQVGLISVGIGVVVGSVLGLLAGYLGGTVDYLVMRFIDLLLAFPGILLALAIVTILGPSLTNVMVAVGISSIPRYSRVVRGSVLSAKENAYVEAARAAGCLTPRIMVRHILPNVFAPVLVLATMGVAGAILWAAGLSFLGLGVQPPTPEWGAILSDGRNYLRIAPWIATFPGLAIMFTVLAINMFGDGLRDALDPRLKV